MDKLRIQGLKALGIIGILDWEQTQPQTLLIDLELCFCFKAATLSENIEETIDYAKVAEQVITWVQEKPYRLLETLASTLADKLLTGYPRLLSTTVAVEKVGAIPQGAKIIAMVSKEQSLS